MSVTDHDDTFDDGSAPPPTDDEIEAACADAYGWTPPARLHAVPEPVDTDPHADRWAGTWQPPRPLVEPPPPFPTLALPTWIAEHANAVADKIQAPVDIACMQALGYLSAVTAGHLKVALDDGWKPQNTNLYLATIAESGVGKSPVDEEFGEPVTNWEAARAAGMATHITKAKFLKDQALKRAKELATSAVASKGKNTSDEEAWEAQQAAEAMEIPVPPRLLVDDATPEALVGLLDRHGGVMAIISTEAALFDHVTGAYTRNPNINVYLQGHTGSTLIVDRKGSGDTGPTQIRIDQPILTIAVCVQPRVIAKVLTNDVLVDRGFTNRFMYAHPATNIGWRNYQRRTQVDTTHTGNTWAGHITAIADRCASWEHPYVIRFDPAARDRYYTWQDDIEARMRPGGQLRNPLARAWAQKLKPTVIRLAALLAAAEVDAHGAQVHEPHITRAIQIGEYWIAHFLHLTAQGTTDPVTEAARRILTWCRRQPVEPMKWADLYNGCRRGLQGPKTGTAEAPDFAAPMRLLVDRGWLRTTEPDMPIVSTGRGKAAPEYELNPHARETESET